MLAAAVVMTGCGTTTGHTAHTPTATRTPTSQPTRSQPVHGLDGTWRPINSDSPITSLTISGTTATTTGRLACPGTLARIATAAPVLTLHCTSPDPDRTQGTITLRPDGTALVINWDGPKWGGALDSLRRA
ncbi:hypothetical protein [Streptomyces yokosukanensis]|nr:hypothetical protein [Streptomyces yokosukanensis]